MNPPPFRVPLDPEGDAYALAVVPGQYLRGAGGPVPAHWVLWWTPATDRPAVSYGSVGADGRPLSWDGGDDELDSAEFALLKCAASEGVPAHCWRLHPAPGGFADPAHASGYAQARRRLALALYRLRTAAWLGAGSPGQLLFRPADPHSPGAPEVAAPDFAELMREVAARYTLADDDSEIVAPCGDEADEARIDRD